jgi:hypothetical protein
MCPIMQCLRIVSVMRCRLSDGGALSTKSAERGRKANDISLSHVATAMHADHPAIKALMHAAAVTKVTTLAHVTLAMT